MKQITLTYNDVNSRNFDVVAIETIENDLVDREADDGTDLSFSHGYRRNWDISFTYLDDADVAFLRLFFIANNQKLTIDAVVYPMGLKTAKDVQIIRYNFKLKCREKNRTAI